MDPNTSLATVPNHPNSQPLSAGPVVTSTLFASASDIKEGFPSIVQNSGASLSNNTGNQSSFSLPQNTGLEEIDTSIDDTESLDSNCSIKKDVSPRTAVPRTSARNITVQTLMQDGLLEPGHGVLSIDYLGQKFYGDLLTTGKILWENTQFASPSSWATYIKKRLNPSKKSGSGWNSVKYKNVKLDKLKQTWLKRNSHVVSTSKASPITSVNDDSNLSNENKTNIGIEAGLIKSNEKKHVPTVDPNGLITCESFSDLKPQPFSVIVSSLVMAVVDFHCHLSKSEVVGYLGGKWEPAKKCLYIMQAFPCRCKLHDHEVAFKMEQEISNNMALNGLIRVGWYHSHSTAALPTLRDVEIQYELQFMNSSHPAVGLICDPYFACDVNRTESDCSMFWVMSNPPTPMKLAYRETEQNISQDPSLEFTQLLSYYRVQNDSVPPNNIWKGTMTYLDKIQVSMQRRLSKEKTGVAQYVRELLSNSRPSQTAPT